MTGRNEIDLRIWIDPLTYMALRARCGQEDRSMSEHVRHLIRMDVLTACQAERCSARGETGSAEGQAGA